MGRRERLVRLPIDVGRALAGAVRYPAADVQARSSRGQAWALDRRLVNGGLMVEEMRAFLAISFGGILGANARYLVAVYIAERFGTAFPYGTFLINATGSLVIGFFLTLITERFTVDPLWRLFFATGFLGAYTTFSTYTYESAQLIRAGDYGLGLLYMLGSVAVGMLGVFAGILVAQRL